MKKKPTSVEKAPTSDEEELASEQIVVLVGELALLLRDARRKAMDLQHCFPVGSQGHAAVGRVLNRLYCPWLHDLLKTVVRG